MSSSSVSISPNPSTPTLRKHAPTGDHNSGLNSQSNDQNHPSPPTAGDPKNPNLSMKPMTAKSTTKSRKQTAVKNKTVSVSKPPWKTAVSVIVKNLGLLIILLLLFQMIRRLGFNVSDSESDVFSPSYGYEKQIREVVKLVKNVHKMMQVQVEVVDRKIGEEIAGLKTELGERIDGMDANFFKKIGEFDGRIERLEKGLGSKEWLSKDEFDRFIEGFEGKDGGLKMKLDEIRGYVRGMVEREIGKHAADGVGRVDYAVASGGGVVVKHSEAFEGGRRVGYRWFGGNVRSDAVKMLQPSFGQPGECFPLKGESGFVEIKLRTAIVPEAITLEHVSKSVAFDLSTAPKDCKVWGWSRNEEDTQNEHLLTEFTYDIEKSSAQTFNVNTEGVNPIIVDTIRLQFMSNHGSPTHTCIYRVRVHGHQPDAS